MVSKDAPRGEYDNSTFDKAREKVLDMFERYTVISQFKGPVAEECCIQMCGLYDHYAGFNSWANIRQKF